jgi:hypothetical protein
VPIVGLTLVWFVNVQSRVPPPVIVIDAVDPLVAADVPDPVVVQLRPASVRPESDDSVTL